ncbi:MAG TPA: RodZ domain-containing protein [Gammaproteobacteria bacterium]|nr:RodZ domain-containing protein [Gammaproteobacteria bacterium]
MSETEDKSNDMPRRGGIGPGERLQAARIKKGLSLEDVASRMHLSANILEAIEENNFDVITAPIFVKGYLRAYARIVSLDEDEMIQQYLDFYSEEDPPINSTSNTVPELSATDARIKWTTYFVIVVLGVLLAAWWWNKQQDVEPPVSLDVQSSRVDENASAEGVVDSDIQAGSETPISADAIALDAESEPPDAAVSTEAVSDAENEGTVDAAVDPVVVGDAVTTEAAVDPATVNTEAAVDPAATTGAVVLPMETESSSTVAEPEPQAIAGTRDRPERIAPSGSDKLKIIIHADTWADVKDSTNYQLVYDLLRADSSVELSGKAPFRIFLGNGHGVEILFNGEEIRFSARIRDDNTARIYVGG